jgi:hypothetical protein
MLDLAHAGFHHRCLRSDKSLSKLRSLLHAPRCARECMESSPVAEDTKAKSPADGALPASPRLRQMEGYRLAEFKDGHEPAGDP